MDKPRRGMDRLKYVRDTVGLTLTDWEKEYLEEFEALEKERDDLLLAEIHHWDYQNKDGEWVNPVHDLREKLSACQIDNHDKLCTIKELKEEEVRLRGLIKQNYIGYTEQESNIETFKSKVLDYLAISLLENPSKGTLERKQDLFRELMKLSQPKQKEYE